MQVAEAAALNLEVLPGLVDQVEAEPGQVVVVEEMVHPIQVAQVLSRQFRDAVGRDRLDAGIFAHGDGRDVAIDRRTGGVDHPLDRPILERLEQHGHRVVLDVGERLEGGQHDRRIGVVERAADEHRQFRGVWKIGRAHV